ncbi:MAG: radical SAM protein [Nitrospirae bacterium]|nr:radical SAM protein [Nitrospirota bacterium]
MNIYFIEAKSPGSHIFSRTPIPRLGAILLATILKHKGHSTKVFIEDISMPDLRLLDDADMVCISSITSTAPRAFELGRRFMSRGITVVMGGAHSTFLPDESLLYADYVVRGEGEETIVELIEHLQSGLPLDTIRGLSFKAPDNTIINNPDRELIQDLDSAPVPDFSLVYNWVKAPVTPIATSRGCPFACRFCSVIPMFGRKYRFKSIGRVVEEIKAAVRLNPKSHVFFVDDNFAADKKRTKTLLQNLIDNKIKFEWSAQVRTDIARDPELIKLMAETGCFAVFVGFESINPKTLDLYNKSQKVEDINNCIKMLQYRSIHIHGMFVFGSDTDDIQTIRNTQKFARELALDSIQFMMLTPLPGTPVLNELREQGRIIHSDWSKYDAHHAVFEPKLMTALELHVETLKAMAKFYSWSYIFSNLLSMDIFYSIVGWYGKKSINSAKSRGREYLSNLRETAVSEFDKKTDRLRKYFLSKHTKSIVMNTGSLEKGEMAFFKIFFKKLGKDLIINKADSYPCRYAFTIAPVVAKSETGSVPEEKYLSEFYERFGRKSDSMKIIKLDSISLYRTCVNIGLLMGVRFKKIRKAYEKALSEIGGTAFECNTILVMVEI